VAGQCLDLIFEDAGIGKLGAVLAAASEAVPGGQPWVSSIVVIAPPQSPLPAFEQGCPMHRLILIATRGVMEILGSVEPSSPNPRRNTSKDFFEALRGGNIVEIRLRFISSPFPLYFRFLPLLPG